MPSFNLSVQIPCRTEWPLLRDIIKFKLNHRSSPTSFPSSSPLALGSSPVNAGLHGLVIPSFPKREPKKSASARVFNNIMDVKEADGFEIQIFEQLDDFEDGPPFTIQRLCELCVLPRKHYKTVGKYLRALERTILVTSTKDMYPSEDPGSKPTVPAGYTDNLSLRLAMTPVFSPIPFLHDDARRSRSPSPFELAATKRPEKNAERTEQPHERHSTGKGLGLVDELDDPKPGHLADRPTALTATTRSTLEERFVKSSGPESDETSRETAESANSKQAEDAEVEGMVLDNNSTAEDEDKENRVL
ncbi:PPP4R2-domain-containing protein [Hysterangium stoloniferum]|nr:PPP4R2-domain-containing protein [Hysterangium stoloniferum]